MLQHFDVTNRIIIELVAGGTVLVVARRCTAGWSGFGTGVACLVGERRLAYGGRMREAVGQQREVTLHGHRMTYRVAGDPDLPVVLLIHGITSSGATWDTVISALATDAHVIAPDLLGHGGSDKPSADYSLGALASSLRDLLERLGHDPVSYTHLRAHETDS